MIDVGGNDGSAPSDLGAHKFGAYFIGDVGAKGFSPVLLGEIVAGNFRFQISDFRVGTSASEILSDGNVFHLRSDDALARVVELGDGLPPFCAQRVPRRFSTFYFILSTSISLRRFFRVRNG